MPKFALISVLTTFLAFDVTFMPLAQTSGQVDPFLELAKVAGQVGAIGVMGIWLWWFNGELNAKKNELREERSAHEMTRRELRDALRDCGRLNSEDRTRPIPDTRNDKPPQ